MLGKVLSVLVRSERRCKSCDIPRGGSKADENFVIPCTSVLTHY